MALKVWTIEIRVDFNDPSRNELALNDIRTHTKELLATMRLLADGRKPDVAIQSDDMFEGRDKIDMWSPEERAEYGIEEGAGMIPGRDQFICARCEEPADEDEAPSYCPHCGWDGMTYATLPTEVTEYEEA